MSLTDEQRAFWDEIGFEPLSDGASEDEIKARVGGIAYVFHLDGYPVPGRATIRAELVRRSSLGTSSDAFLLTTSSGRSVNLSDPRPEDIFAEDIASALSKICRFGAQATSFYSVAQHALEVAHRVPDALRLAALHHDSHEAFAGDLPTPLKRLIASSSSVYDDLCKRLDAAVGSAFGVDPSTFDHPEVKRADQTVRVLEASGLLADGGREVRRALGNRRWLAASPIDQSGVFGRILSQDEAEEEFLKAHAQWCDR